MTSRERDRDERGRARNARPRDELGRPLPYGAPGSAPLPAGRSAAPDQALRLAQQLLDEGRPFQAHEVLEEAWKSGVEAERELWQGLAQLAVGITHAARGNRRGAQALLDRAGSRLAGFVQRPPHGIAVQALLRWLADADRSVGRGAGPLILEPPRLRAD